MSQDRAVTALLRTSTFGSELNDAVGLSRLLSDKERTGDSHGAALLQQVSPVAWQHINLHGRYEFRKSPEAINIDAIVQELSQLPITQDMDD